MKRLAIALVVSGALTLVSMNGEEAQAGDFSIHIGTPGLHVDVGRPHGYRSLYRGVGRSRVAPYGYRSRRRYVLPQFHYDYYPTEIIPHGSHYHVIPGHVDRHYGSPFHW